MTISVDLSEIVHAKLVFLRPCALCELILCSFPGDAPAQRVTPRPSLQPIAILHPGARWVWTRGRGIPLTATHMFPSSGSRPATCRYGPCSAACCVAECGHCGPARCSWHAAAAASSGRYYSCVRSRSVLSSHVFFAAASSGRPTALSTAIRRATPCVPPRPSPAAARVPPRIRRPAPLRLAALSGGTCMRGGLGCGPTEPVHFDQYCVEPSEDAGSRLLCHA